MRPETAGALSAAAGLLAALAGVAAWHAYGQPTKRRPPLIGPGLAPAAASADALSSSPSLSLSSSSLQSDPIIREQLTRNVQFFGSAGQGSVCDALVVVVGLGVRAKRKRDG